MEGSVRLPSTTEQQNLCMYTEKGTGDPLIQQHGQQGYDAALYEIQRCNAQGHKVIDPVDAAVDLGAHADQSWANLGSRYTALKAVPMTVMVRVPITRPTIAPFLFLWV